MKKIISAFCLTAISLFVNPSAFAQEDKKDQIAKVITDYFFLERENIHVHFDKNVFMTDESAWFKGYVFHRKKNAPFFNTVNIYATLMDDQGKMISTQLIYGNMGSFSGNFKLGNQLKSGKYYVQFYTNWMNNFTEDESAVYEISVINQSTGVGNILAKADPSKINIEFRPEGGTLVYDTPNSIGISISDCNHNPLPITVVDIVDSTGKNIKKVQINKLGYGKFDLLANSITGYKAVVTIEDIKHEQPLPLAQPKGIALEVNNYAVAGKTIVKIRANKSTLDSFTGKSIYMVAHQDDKMTVFEIKFNDQNLEQTVVIPNSELAEGMNTIRILDTDMNELAERMIYKYPEPGLNVSLTQGKQTGDELQYNGKINYPNMNMSISVLPESTISFEETNDIYSSLLILPYLENQKKTSGKYYFESPSKVKQYELDLFLVNQKSKYKWRDILKNPPKSTYSFDMGLTLKGTIPSTLGNVNNAKVRVYSLTSSIDEIADINVKREFYFENMVIADSSYVNFTLLKKGAKPKEITVIPQLLNSKRRLNKPYQPQPRCYAPQGNNIIQQIPNIYKENIQLEEIKIEGSTLKYANSFGNGNLVSYKISDEKANMYQNLTNFIKAYSNFEIIDRNGLFIIQTRGANSINAAKSGPIVYIDNVQALGQVTDSVSGLDYSNVLNPIQMHEVDEIYMSSTAIVPSIRNYVGIIKIYLKKDRKPIIKNSTPQIIMKNGYERIKPFTNITYNSTTDKGFENFGVVDWQPTIMTDENGNFKLSIPKIYRKPIKVLIEGFSADGKLISEIKILDTVK
ncbi:hypothetical protein [Flavobacterium cerinum]|uniref:TonB-dependent receptor n=1 Tax=Flavobacterium cerinum TaxID=2502784 RepID=A0A3S3QN34_9FLAO|nr:hypothetical protein [Flavobacterium cerinum]RWX03776.1 hypothetical protein EPI11_02255 [Flavobacterium cerinum]